MEFSSWLDERFVHDVSARNKSVEQACFSYFDKQDVINIMDVGSGTGSTFLALYARIENDQNWTFLEQDAKLIDHSVKRICKELAVEGFQIETLDNKTTFSTDSRTITLTTLNDSLLNIDTYLRDLSIDLVTAYAKFDQIVRGHNCAILSVLNYTGMSFNPVLEGDDTCIELYHGHMLRSQHFGIGMGPNCHRDIKKYYSDNGANYTEGNSIWHLDPQAQAMHGFILEYMEIAINEMPGRPEYFNDWLKNRRQESGDNRLLIQVDHFDYFVAP